MVLTAYLNTTATLLWSPLVYLFSPANDSTPPPFLQVEPCC
jgi:hypothetical protein